MSSINSDIVVMLSRLTVKCSKARSADLFQSEVLYTCSSPQPPMHYQRQWPTAMTAIIVSDLVEIQRIILLAAPVCLTPAFDMVSEGLG